MIRISSAFDAGNIVVESAGCSDDIRVRIRPDTAAEFAQWFHFRLSGAKGVPCTIRVLNAAECSYPEGWQGYRACASHDGETWFRVPTAYDGTVLTIRHTPEADAVWYAYFEPYSYERHQSLLAGSQAVEGVRLESLGATLQGRDLDLLTIGDEDPARPKLWVIARQHPGETMAEWFVEGLLERLLDAAEPVARALRARATFYVVPNMNPDGAVAGNLRTNAAGANLNREWLEPSAERSPEVLHVRTRMQATGVDLFLDVHGDEVLPYVFVAGNEGIPSYDPRLAALEDAFKTAYARVSPDFQDEHGYARNAPGQANLTMASKWVGETFGCLSYTLEMPFKDNADAPDPAVGWDGGRSRHLGRAALDVMLALLERLRA